MKKIGLFLLLTLFLFQAKAQTPWTASPPVSGQTRTMPSGEKQLRFIWGANIWNISDSLANVLNAILPPFDIVSLPVAGQHINAGSIANQLQQIYNRAIPPTYNAPSNYALSSPGANNHEIGTVFSGGSITLGHGFNQADAGTETGTTFLKNGSSITSPDNFTLTSQVYYQAVTSYNQGPIKNDSHGNPYPTGRISAGSVTSAPIYFTPLPQRYWGRCSTTAATDAEILASSGGSTGGGSELTTSKAKSGFVIAGNGSLNNIFFAYPASLGTLTSIFVGGFESIGSFTPVTRSFTNASGYTQSYIIYTYNNKTSNSSTLTTN